jgi:hypothetical protein
VQSESVAGKARRRDVFPQALIHGPQCRATPQAQSQGVRTTFEAVAVSRVGTALKEADRCALIEQTVGEQQAGGATPDDVRTPSSATASAGAATRVTRSAANRTALGNFVSA